MSKNLKSNGQRGRGRKLYLGGHHKSDGPGTSAKQLLFARMMVRWKEQVVVTKAEFTCE